MKNKLLAEQWRIFEQNVIPKNAPLIQKQEMRRAWYAGAAAMFSLVTDAGDEEMSEEEGAKILDGLEKECVEFLSQVGKKY